MTGKKLFSVQGHDVVVIGASLGGFDALALLLAQLPEDFPASVFAVIHLHPHTHSAMDRLLAAHAALRVKFAEEGEAFVPGTVYLAPPDRHLLIADDLIRLSSGPRENRVRPAIDSLFRSAAVAYGPRVIGVQLTGMLDDGIAGLAAIKACGGLVLVQDPQDAVAPEMPQNALDLVEVDRVARLAVMGSVLREMVAAEAPPAVPVPDLLRMEARILECMPDIPMEERILGPVTPLTCPDCGGSLSEMHEHGFARYRCHEGHAFGPHTLADAQWGKTEYALWSAVRLMEEQSTMLRRMGSRENLAQSSSTSERYRSRADEIHSHAQQVKEFLVEFARGRS